MSMLRFVLAHAIVVVISALMPPHPDFTDFEPVHEYRARNNITFNFEPEHLTHEHCRYLTEERCQKEDEARGLAKQRRILNPSIGKFKVLVILVRFSDHRNLVLPPRSHFETLFNGRGTSDINPVGSIREYIRYNSLGANDVEFDVRDWRDLSFSESHYAAGESGLIGNVQIQAMYSPIMDQLDEEGTNWFEYDVASEKDLTMGDGQLDHLVIIHSGLGGEHGDADCLPGTYKDRIWSQGSGSTAEGWESKSGYKAGGVTIASGWRTPLCDPRPADMGVITHEFLHGFKLLDLYDAQQGRANIGGIGSYGIMSNAFGWRRSWSAPSHMSAFSRIASHWLDPIEITADGFYAIQPSEISAQIYKISAPYPDGEYLLIENRQNIKFDNDWAGSGIVIYHVDEKQSGQDNRGYPGSDGWPKAHYSVAVLQADGNYDIEKGINGGDEGDFFVKGKELGPGGAHPNTDSYQNGNVRSTGLRITVLTDSRYIMLFQVSGLGGSRAPALAFSAGLNPIAADDGVGTHWSITWIVAMLSGMAVVTGVAAMML